MKIKKKGKVHPSPPPPPSLSDDVSSVLHLLPAAILALVTLLSADDRHVLAYMITRSMRTAPSSSSSSKLACNNYDNKSRRHVFGCDCFDCYRSYWFRWDSSPNRELIHQAIEAFEDHVAAKPSRKAKTSRRRQAQKSPESEEEQVFVVAPPVVVEEVLNVEGSSISEVGRVEEEELGVEKEVKEEGALSLRAAAAGSSYKGFARKVLPDVLGLFNSRLWKLWSPNA